MAPNTYLNAFLNMEHIKRVASLMRGSSIAVDVIGGFSGVSFLLGRRKLLDGDTVDAHVRANHYGSTDAQCTFVPWQTLTSRVMHNIHTHEQAVDFPL